MEKPTLIIDSVESLYPLRQEARRGGRRQYAELRLSVPQLSTDENAAWQRRVDDAYFACGCGEGAAFGAAAIVAYAVWAVVRPAPVGWMDALWLVVAFFVASGLGKALGLARARRGLATTLDDLHALLEQRRARRAASSAMATRSSLSPSARFPAPRPAAHSDRPSTTSRSKVRTRSVSRTRSGTRSDCGTAARVRTWRTAIAAARSCAGGSEPSSGTRNT
jgi:hypothetical protein